MRLWPGFAQYSQKAGVSNSHQRNSTAGREHKVVEAADKALFGAQYRVLDIAVPLLNLRGRLQKGGTVDSKKVNGIVETNCLASEVSRCRRKNTMAVTDPKSDS